MTVFGYYIVDDCSSPAVWTAHISAPYYCWFANTYVCMGSAVKLCMNSRANYVSSCCCAVMPIYTSGGALEDSSSSSNSADFMLFTMANVPKSSQLLWAPFSLSIVFTVYGLVVLYYHLCSYAALRMLHLHSIETKERIYNPTEPPKTTIACEKTDASFWRKFGELLLILVSPKYMYERDVKLLEKSSKEYEGAVLQEAERVHDIPLDTKLSNAKKAVEEFSNCSYEGVDTPICPWWLPPKDIPLSVNSAYKAGGVLLGKSACNLRQRCLAWWPDGSLSWAQANLYVVLYRDAGESLHHLWYNVPEHVMSNGKRGTQDKGGSVKSNPEDRLGKLEKSLKGLFPDSFQELVPVYYFRRLDETITRWDKTVARIFSLQAKLIDMKIFDAQVLDTYFSSKQHGNKIPDDKYNPEWDLDLIFSEMGSSTVKVKSKTKERLLRLLEQLHEAHADRDNIENLVTKLRQEALENPCQNAAFAIFSNRRAAIAARTGHIGEVPKINMIGTEAPGSDEVNWQALWSTSKYQFYTLLKMSPFYAIVILFPIGFITGALTNLEVAVCGGNQETNSWYWAGFCQSDLRVVRFLMTTILPVTISAVWDTYFMPIVLYLMTQRLRIHESFTRLDTAITIQLYVFSVLNTFIFSVLGGAALSQIGAAIKSGKSSVLWLSMWGCNPSIHHSHFSSS